MKSKLKKVIPKPIKKQIQYFKRNRELNQLVASDKKRFKKYSAKQASTTDYNNIRSQLMYFTHQIEKGLSRQNFRSGFGRSVIINLLDAIQRMKLKENWQNDDFYYNAISALKAYKIKHLEIDNIVPNFDLIPVDILKEIDECDSDTAGVIPYTSSDKSNNDSLDFKNLALNRFSIRDFKQNESVNIDDLMEVIEISTKSPSVCNRQPARVKIITDKIIMEKVLKLQGGFRGYELPDKLLLVTSDVSVFLRAQERNQAYTDGGLFSMSLMYSLEYKGIGACPLSTNIAKKKIDEICSLLEIPESETLIMFIACGIMEDNVKCPKSYRTPSSHITTII